MPETQDEKTFDRINMEDHKAINTLVSSTSAFHAVVNEKLDNTDKKFDDVVKKIGEMKQEFNAAIKEVRDGMSTKIAEHDRDINTCKISRTRQNVTVGIGIALMAILTTLVTQHIVK